MDNRYSPPDGDSSGWPTEQLGHVTGPVAGQAGHAEPDGAAGSAWSYQAAGGRRPRRGLRQAMAAVAAAALIGGGAIAGAALSGGTSPAASGPTGQAGVLDTILSSASSPASAALAATTSAAPHAGAGPAAHCRAAARRLRAAGRPWEARAALRACGRRLLRLRVLAGIHGQFTFETKSGPRTLKFERGVVVSVSSTAVVVRAQDGTTWTWDLVSNTVVRQNPRRAAASALSAGQHVFVGGPVTGGANDARLIVIRAKGHASASS